MIFDLGDRRERDLDDLSIRDLNLYAGCGESLGGFHTSNCSAHAPAVGCDDLHVIFAVKWLQGCERFGDFQGKFLPVRYLAFYGPGSLPKPNGCNRESGFGV